MAATRPFATVLLLALLGQRAAARLTTCEKGVNLPGSDLAGMPTAADSQASCAAKCLAEPECVAFSFHRAGCSYAGESCPLASGCCFLKSGVTPGKAPTVNNCTCSATPRVPPTKFVPSANATGARNVLYVLVDDLRPELEAYLGPTSATTHHAPNILKLSQTGTTFLNSYCQISVCSPSRMSFLTGRRPDHSGIYNFIDHFRQADCGLNAGGAQYDGGALRSVVIGGCEGQFCGGSGQCCSLCTEDRACTHWTFTPENKTCALFGGRATSLIPNPGAISGVSGTVATRSAWTTMPQHFKNNGYLALSTGKTFHTEEGGAGNADPALNGPGMPPNSDPPSWSDGLWMPRVNDVARMYGCAMGAHSTCPVAASADGMVRDPAEEGQLCDRVIADDAVLKLRLAAANRAATGQPFFLAVGFRKPHLAFRFPRPMLDLLPDVKDVDVAAQRCLDPSVPSIAHHDATPQATPWSPAPNATARQWRLFYRAAIAWMDSQIGRVMDELEALGLENDTAVVLHSDHGWSLGEHGEWQKFSNFEHGTRVPLLVRVPWLPASHGMRTRALAELLDVYPTLIDLMGLPPVADAGGGLDGKSLAPVLRGDGGGGADFALSQYMRCPANESVPWRANDCLQVDRSQIPFMGYTLRTKEWRYTEWVEWDGRTLRPKWERVVGVELYPHTERGEYIDFDEGENRNVNASHPEVVKRLSSQLRAIVANTTRLWA